MAARVGITSKRRDEQQAGAFMPTMHNPPPSGLL
jgi:hypothetical protein